MNTTIPKTSLIGAIVTKDIHLNKYPLLGYLVLGLVSLMLISSSNKAAFYGGAVLMLSMVIVVGAHMVYNTITSERRDQHLPFLLSLPITFTQYTHAKILSNLGVFMAFWLIMVIGLMLVISNHSGIPNGMMVYTTLLMLEMLAVFVMLMSIGLITESQSWTTVFMAITNIGLSLFMLWLSSVEAIRIHMDGSDVVWNQTALLIAGSELVIIILCLVMTHLIQARKKDFL